MEKKSKIQELAEKICISYDEFIGEMRKKGCSEPTDVLKVGPGSLLPK